MTCPNHASFRLLTIANFFFLWTHKEVDLAPLPVVGLVLQIGDAKFPHALGFESLDPFFQSQQSGLTFDSGGRGGVIITSQKT